MAALEAGEEKEEAPAAEVKDETKDTHRSEIERMMGISGTYSKTSLASEIERLMGEFQTEENPVVQPEKTFEPEEAEDSTRVFAAAEPQGDTIEHPVLAKKLEEPEPEEEVVEETAEIVEPTSELLNETKPFIIEKTKTNTVIEDEDDDEEPAPSKLLNIILIVLTIALIAVLGVVIYGLLKTEGII